MSRGASWLTVAPCTQTLILWAERMMTNIFMHVGESKNESDDVDLNIFMSSCIRSNRNSRKLYGICCRVTRKSGVASLARVIYMQRKAIWWGGLRKGEDSGNKSIEIAFAPTFLTMYFYTLEDGNVLNSNFIHRIMKPLPRKSFKYFIFPLY